MSVARLDLVKDIVLYRLPRYSNCQALPVHLIHTDYNAQLDIAAGDGLEGLLQGGCDLIQAHRFPGFFRDPSCSRDHLGTIGLFTHFALLPFRHGSSSLSSSECRNTLLSSTIRSRHIQATHGWMPEAKARHLSCKMLQETSCAGDLRGSMVLGWHKMW